MSIFRKGTELVTGIPNFNTGQQEGITILESYYMTAMGVLPIGPNESNEDYSERCWDLANKILDTWNKHQN